jgi:esterase FrsA
MIPKELFTTLCLLTGQTGRAASKLRVRYFLPHLFLLRYSNFGDLDPEAFKAQMDGLKSFEESAWCSYWNAIAIDYEQEAERLQRVGGSSNNNDFVNLLKKALTYYSVSAFPGHTPMRIDAYHKAAALFERMLPLIDNRLEKMTFDIAGERVEGFVRFPEGEGKYPMVIITNGLEGTIPEIALPLMKYKDAEMGMFFMEMPGTYAYKKPMSGASEEIYNAVIDNFAADKRVDANRIGMMGVSFGGYWAARMAAINQRLSCSVVCGAPLNYTFSLYGSLGKPEIIVAILKKLTGTRNIIALRLRLHDLSFAKKDFYRRINIPLLIINGDNDTLCRTKDSIVLDIKVPGAFLKLYENDDHCAMGHYEEWLDLTFAWLQAQFKN